MSASLSVLRLVSLSPKGTGSEVCPLGRRDNSTCGFSSLWPVPRRRSQAPRGLLFLLGKDSWAADCLPVAQSGRLVRVPRVPRTGCKEVVSIGGDHGYACGESVLGRFSPLAVLTGEGSHEDSGCLTIFESPLGKRQVAKPLV